MFSDILTPLPALGIEFDVIKGKGPLIPQPIRTSDDLKRLRTLDDPASQLPFVAPVLKALRSEVGNASTVMGFVGTPWTLAAYAMEGKAEKHCLATKTIMQQDPEVRRGGIPDYNPSTLAICLLIGLSKKQATALKRPN